MKQEDLIKALNFNQSDIWDAVLFIIDKQIDFELRDAVATMKDESQRAHACGRIDGLYAAKDVLISSKESVSQNYRVK